MACWRFQPPRSTLCPQNAFHNFFVSEWIYFALFMACALVLTANHGMLSRYEPAASRHSHSPMAIIRKPE